MMTQERRLHNRIVIFKFFAIKYNAVNISEAIFLGSLSVASHKYYPFQRSDNGLRGFFVQSYTALYPRV